MPSSLSMLGRPLASFSWHSINRAVELIFLTVSITIAFSSAVTKSVLLSRMRSEKAIWWIASLMAPSGCCASSMCCMG